MGNNQETVSSALSETCNRVISCSNTGEYKAAVGKSTLFYGITVITGSYYHVIKVKAHIAARAAKRHRRTVLDVLKHDDILLCHSGQFNHLFNATTSHMSGTAGAA